MTEIWKPIPDYDGRYEASNLGRIRSLPHRVEQRSRAGNPFVRTVPGKILSPGVDGRGYLFFQACRMGEVRPIRVHRAVCLAFHGSPPAGSALACHNDGDHRNNVPGNLRWGSGRENMLDREKHGTGVAGERNPRAKLTVEDVRTIRRRFAMGERAKTIASDFGVHFGRIYMIKAGAQWKDVA